MPTVNIASVLALIQLIVSLLSRPNLTPSQKQVALALGNQVVALATQALQEPSSTPVGVVATTTQDIIASSSAVEAPAPVAIGAPDLSSQTPVVVQGTPEQPQEVVTPPQVEITQPTQENPVAPSCSLAGVYDPPDDRGGLNSAEVTWTLTNIPSSTNAYWQIELGHDGGTVIYSPTHTILLNTDTSVDVPTTRGGIIKFTFGNQSCFLFPLQDASGNHSLTSTIPNWANGISL